MTQRYSNLQTHYDTIINIQTHYETMVQQSSDTLWHDDTATFRHIMTQWYSNLQINYDTMIQQPSDKLFHNDTATFRHIMTQWYSNLQTHYDTAIRKQPPNTLWHSDTLATSRHILTQRYTSNLPTHYDTTNYTLATNDTFAWLICCRVILTASSRERLLICRSLAIRLHIVLPPLRLGRVRWGVRIKLGPNYGGTDPLVMFPLFLKRTAEVMAPSVFV